MTAMTTTKAPSILTAEGARRLTGQIRDALAVADDLLVRAYTGRAWEALGHGSFAAYCAAELPELSAIKLRREPLEARIAALRDVGATIPEIVAATGSSLGTVHRRLVAREGGHTRAPQRGPRKTNRVVELIAAAGPDGLDVRDVQKALRCQRNQASATLTRLHDQQRIRYVEPERRGLFGRYVAC